MPKGVIAGTSLVQRELQAACCIEYNWMNLLITSFLEFIVLFCLAVRRTDSIWGWPLPWAREDRPGGPPEHWLNAYPSGGPKEGKEINAEPPRGAKPEVPPLPG